MADAPVVEQKSNSGDSGGVLKPIRYVKCTDGSGRYIVTCLNERILRFNVTTLSFSGGIGFDVEPDETINGWCTKEQQAPVAGWLAQQLAKNR